MKSSQNVLYSGESCENGMAVQTLNRTSGSRMSLRKREKQAQSVVFYARRCNGLHVTEVQSYHFLDLRGRKQLAKSATI